MRKFRIVASSLFAVLLMLFLGGCGQETAYVADSTRPVVTSTSPAAGATGVSLSPPITATFSKPMNAATLTGSTFTVTGPGGVAVAGTVAYQATGSIATFSPASALAFNTTYVATITTGAQDRALPANSLLANYVWSFTTALSPTPPTVLSTNPRSNATGVPVNQVVSATFSRAMNPATINTSDFVITGPGGSAVGGTVAYAGTTASFTPSSPLATNTTYLATVTTGAQDTNGTALATNYAWTFTTVSAAPPAILPVVLSTNPTTGATGVPVNQLISAVFSKAMNAATINATTFTVAGPGSANIAGTVSYSPATNTATFAPSGNLSTGSTYIITITTGAQDTTGNGLAANYVSAFRTVAAPAPPTVIATNPPNNATGVPFNQKIAATFSSAMNPATINGTTFLLKAPGGIAVPGTVTYTAAGSVATFSPTAALLPNVTYVATVTVGAQDTMGTALASNYVWVFTTGAAPDTTAPTVISTLPLNTATGVPFNQAISATFSEPINASTITPTSFTVTGAGGTPVAGAVSYASIGNTATFTPSENLAAGTLFTATITTGVTDLAGNALATNYVWTFTTGAAPDTTPPTVTSTIPGDGATAVALNQAVLANFSEAMDPLSITNATFQLTGPGGTVVAATITYNPVNFIATLQPALPLAAGTSYIATVTSGATDLAGNHLAAGSVPNPWTFTTVVTSPILVPPTVLSTNPGSGATGVPVNQVISAVFSKAMNPATINATTFTVQGPGSSNIAGVISYAAGTNTATFTPAGNLATSSTYIVTITTGAQDTAGNALVANYVWGFRTVAAPAPPTVITTNPLNNATGVPFNQQIAATFSSAMNPATINGTTFLLTAPGGIPVAGTVSYVAAGSVATFSPTVALLPNLTYVATITTGARDTMGTALANNYTWVFTTGAAPDTTRPTVISTIPLNGATNVPFNQAISATFSEAMNAATITSSSFRLTGAGGAPVAGLVTYAAVGNTATFNPTANLAPGTVFTATVTTGATDLAGNSLLTNYVWTFTTGAAPDTTPPTVVATVPLNGATGVPLNQAISATFSEAMNPLSITTATFRLTGPGGSLIPATITYNPISFIATLQPTLPLTGGTTYIATVTTGATDLAGNPLGAGSVPNPWNFTTGIVIVPPPVDLGTAALFGGFGGSAGMTNDGTSTIINGNIGTTGVSTLITGFHDLTPGCTYSETPLNMGAVNGAIDTAPPPPTGACPNEGTALTSSIAAQASADAGAAYLQLAGIPGGMDVSVCPGCGGGSAGELGNRTLVGGVYKSAPGTYGITQGDLVLDAKGSPNAFWVFQAATTLTVGTPSAHRSVLLVNGAQAKNVFWQVGTHATINGVLGGGTMSGTIISQTGVTVSTTGVAAVTTINGRALSLTGPVILDNTVINVPAP